MILEEIIYYIDYVYFINNLNTYNDSLKNSVLKIKKKDALSEKLVSVQYNASLKGGRL